MLGDFAHDYPLPYQGLIATLDTWLSMVEKGECGDRRLVLFLEEDSLVADLLTRYLKSGDMTPLLGLILPLTSIERLEFYSDLRTIAAKIETMNGALPATQHIGLDIQGPEAFNILDPRMIDQPAKPSRLYFVRERDSLASINVIAYLKAHPDRKGLLFFGNGHLIQHAVRKDFSGILSPEESEGRFLGSYLKEEFGDSAVFTISLIGRSRSQLALDAFAGRDVFLLSSQATWGEPPSGDNDVAPGNFDAFIIRDGFMVPAHPLRYVFSTRIVGAAIGKLVLSEPHRSGVMGDRIFRQSLGTLAFLADTSLSSADEWVAWNAVPHRDCLDRITSGALKTELAARSARLLGTREFGGIIDELIGLGYDSRVGSPTMTQEEWGAYLDAQWPQIVSLNAIGALWVGDPAEQSAAKKYLRDVCGQSFDAPAQYLRWWRKQYFHVSY
jgi:hypothetical protein